jgi:hypothetical protein
MKSLTKILSEIMQESSRRKLTELEAVLFEDCMLFQEVANPDLAYSYEEVEPNIWIFQDRYKNTLGVRFDPSSKFFESFYILKDLKGQEVRVYDYKRNQHALQPDSFIGGSDEHRSDTICKILRDEIVPKYLLNKEAVSPLIKLHPIDEYRHKIFLKCAEVCQEIYPNIKIQDQGNMIILAKK